MNNRLTPEQLLHKQSYCIISTSTPTGEPWSTPVFFAWDSHWNIYWISSLSSFHSRLLADNPKASTVLYAPASVAQEASALYLTGVVKVCEGAVLEQAMSCYGERTGLGVNRAAQEFLGASPCRFYCLAPSDAYVLGEAEYDGNLLLDQRVRIELP